jgi:hypothetical protein
MHERLALLSCLALSCTGEAVPDGDEQPPPPMVCEAEGHVTSAEAQPVGSVEATVQDLAGNAPSGLLVQVCGLDLCINGETDQSGYAAVSVGDSMLLPAFKYGDGLRYGKLALLLSDASGSVDLGELALPVMPTTGFAIAQGAIASSAGVELSVAEGATVTFDRLTYRTEDEQAFRAAELPPDRAPAGFGEGFDFELFYSLGPLDTELCPAASLSLPNGAGFEPGSEVELFLHGLDIAERHAPYGGFAKFADGVVSDDGETILTTSGGLPLISLVAVRRKG